MRSFVAINLPAAVKSDIGSIIDRLRSSGPPARWVPCGNVHLTLKFLDEIREDQVTPIRDALTLALAGITPFNVQLGGFGVFPNERRARVFWVGIEAGFDILRPLALKIDQELIPLGFTPESRPFSAHVTLARLRDPGPADRLVKAAAGISFHSELIRVDQVDLMRSTLSPKGAEYSIITSVLLPTA